MAGDRDPINRDDPNLFVTTELRDFIGDIDRTTQTAIEQDYLDRVALEAMKRLIPGMDWENDPEAVIDFVAVTAYALARTMLKERSREVGE